MPEDVHRPLCRLFLLDINGPLKSLSLGNIGALPGFCASPGHAVYAVTAGHFLAWIAFAYERLNLELNLVRLRFPPVIGNQPITLFTPESLLPGDLDISLHKERYIEVGSRHPVYQSSPGGGVYSQFYR